MVINPKIGDTVRCVYGYEANSIVGYGYSPNLKFIVTDVHNDICFGGVGNCGVYFKYLYFVNKIIKIW